MNDDTICVGAPYRQFFEDNYDSVRKWAAHITRNNRDLCDDVVHDTFVKLCRIKNANEVRNPGTYLYTSLRNAYLSRLRKDGAVDLISLLEATEIAAPSHQSDHREQFDVREQLAVICDYACKRKSSSISGSIVILRFFHGYYVGEIEQIVKRSRNAVEARIVAARRELDRYFEHRETLRDSGVESEFRRYGRSLNRVADTDALVEIRSRIFDRLSGSCASRNEIIARYRKGDKPIGRERLSHMVSCVKCLDRVNEVLEFPSLAERHPLDSLRDRDNSVKTSPGIKDRIAAAANSLVLKAGGILTVMLIFAENMTLLASVETVAGSL